MNVDVRDDVDENTQILGGTQEAIKDPSKIAIRLTMRLIELAIAAANGHHSGSLLRSIIAYFGELRSQTSRNYISHGVRYILHTIVRQSLKMPT